MTATTKARQHLVERAVEALGLARTTAAVAPASEASTSEIVLPPVPPLASPSPPPPTPVAAPPPAPAVSLDLLRSAGLVIGAGGAMRDRVTEEISLIRHQVVRTVASAESGQGRSGRIILVTSARPGEGKTFVSLNLAGSIAVAGSAPVLLVDADGKRGSLTELLGLAQAPGLRQLAAGATVSAPKLFTATTELPRLSFLPYGPAGDGPPTTSSGSSPSAAAILRLSRNLPDHLIILDSPPCLATSDPTGLAAVAGQVLMVVQAERTQRAEVEAALDLVDACPVLQLVLNKIRVANNDGFGSYSYDSAYLGRSDAAGG